MKRASVAGLFVGVLLALTSTVYGSDGATMSDVQHRKVMGGMHHPEKQGDGMEGNSPVMSDTQHKKHMGGAHHPAAGEGRHKGENGKHPTMSDAQHKKHMGAGKHEYHERTNNPEN